jgi:hypothetical protein
MPDKKRPWALTHGLQTVLDFAVSLSTAGGTAPSARAALLLPLLLAGAE